MGKKVKKSKTFTKIVIATFIAIFSLMSAFTGTIAWFTSSARTTVTGGSFTVQTPTGIGFELYYLVEFDDKYGNYNEDIDEYVGYESASTGAVFASVNDVDLEHEKNPVDISHIWPAHRLTYAMYLSGGNYSNFILDSWEETSSVTPSKIFSVDSDVVDASSFSTQQAIHDLYIYVLSSESYVIANEYDENIDTYYYASNAINYTSLCWAINIYGAAYKVADQGNLLDTISYGFDTFKNESTDKFEYSQTSPAPNPASSTNISVATGTTGSGAITVLYFSIEFSNSSDTFYKTNSDGSFNYKDTNGNSNCYKGLSLNSLVFKLV